MKVLLVLCLIGLAAASVYEDIIEIQSRKAVKSFREGLDEVESLAERLGLEDDEFVVVVQHVEEEAKKEIADRFKEKLDEVLEKLKDKIDNHGEKAKEGLDKAKDVIQDLLQKLHKLGEDAGEKAKEILGSLKEKVGDFWKNLLKSQAPVRDGPILDILRDIKAKIDENETLQNIRQFIQDRVNNSVLKRFLVNLLDTFGLDRLKEHIENLLGGDKNNVQRRALKDLLERVRELLDGRVVTNWVKDLLGKGAENSRRSMAIIEDMVKVASLED